ncbi:hypothetical protein D3C75_781450 [compost metagenome]
MVEPVPPPTAWPTTEPSTPPSAPPTAVRPSPSAQAEPPARVRDNRSMEEYFFIDTITQ